MRGRHSWMLVVALTACNQLLGLDETRPLPDAPPPPPPPDGDADGVADALDNCPAVANPEQGDEDFDALGDVCDNCPLVANPLQEHFGDSDGLGDLCDPRPTDGADCVFLLETFRDPAMLAQGWTIVSDPSDPVAPEVVTSAGVVTLRPHASYRVGMLMKDFSGFTDIEVLGAARFGNASGMIAAASASDIDFGYACRLDHTAADEAKIRAEIVKSLEETTAELVPLAPVADTLLVRQTFANPFARTLALQCRVDHGVSVGTVSLGTLTLDPDGTPGVGAYGSDVRIDAVVITGQSATGTCPTPVVR